MQIHQDTILQATPERNRVPEIDELSHCISQEGKLQTFDDRHEHAFPHQYRPKSFADQDDFDRDILWQEDNIQGELCESEEANLELEEPPVKLQAIEWGCNAIGQPSGYQNNTVASGMTQIFVPTAATEANQRIDY